MIKTTLAHLQRYISLHPAFPEAFAALKKLAAEPFCAGVTQVDGQKVFINAFSYETKPREQGQMEAHRRYIDVMYVYSGREEIGFCPTESLTQLIAPYAQEADALLARLPEQSAMLAMQAGDIAIFFPEDAHAPGLVSGETGRVEKLVAKVLL